MDIMEKMDKAARMPIPPVQWCNEAAAEIARLRGALRRIVALDPSRPIGEPPDPNFFIDQAQYIARSALPPQN